jgi:membrane-bound metal-dependent hydrolase YbcI (DUF457 family)
MAGFKMHVTTSSVCGVAYAGAGYAMGVPLETAMVAGGLCGVSGMLPDVDSGSGRPLRETMGFAAAVVPMLLVDRFQQLGLSYEQLVLATGGLYLLIRYGLAKMLAKYTVHRGMFHSIPAALTFAGVAFLVCGCSDLNLRYFKAGAVLLGVMSHLILDEIYSVQFNGIRGVRFKKSLGTALKFWGSSPWANLSAYAKLAIVTLLILGEPMVMERYGEISPYAIQHASWNVHEHDNVAAGQNGERSGPGNLLSGFRKGDSRYAGNGTNWWTPQAPPNQAYNASEPKPGDPSTDQTIYDTARRLWKSVLE